MKNLTVKLLVILSLSLFSCDKAPDNKVYATQVEKGDWIVPSPGSEPVQAVDTLYQIAPTWGQSFSFASSRGDHALYVTVGVLFLFLFLAVLLAKVSNANWLPEVLHGGFFGSIFLGAVLLVGVYLMTNHAIGIKNNNYKWVKKDLYYNAIKESGSTQPIWDSLQKNCLIVDGPYNCYEK